ncbi:MAG: N-acetyltransferase [Rhodobacteraceae bacterium]|nr:N-acetyltransferase [Paracoccaceae bacterium]
MDGQTETEVTVIGGLDQVSAADWDACACPEIADGGRTCDPFTTHRFLKALEDSGSVGHGTGWQPCHILARRDGELIGVMPCYAKSHSQGEYIFDHNWALFYENAGGRYYPKFQTSVPFTPATGRRFLTKPGEEAFAISALARGAMQLARQNQVSGLHITFCTDAEAEAGKAIGLLHRTGRQFHWYNRDYADFDGFLADLSSRKRKNIRKERRSANAFGGTIHKFTGGDIRPEHWDAFWCFYQDTGARKWGSPYLTRDFFNRAQDSLRDDILLILCEREGRWVAGAMNFIGRDCLYGRYWGCIEHHDCLHFEVCYYRAIDYAIAHGLGRVEAGAQGTHKLARGYLPCTINSLHWIADPGFRDAIARYLDAERDMVGEEIEVMTAYGPFRKVKGEDDDREID